MSDDETMVSIVIPLESHRHDPETRRPRAGYLNLRKVADESRSDSQIEVGTPRIVIIGHTKEQWAKLRDMCTEIVDQYEALEDS